MTLASLAFMTGLAISLEAMMLASVLGSLCLMLIVAKRRVGIAYVRAFSNNHLLAKRKKAVA